VGSAATTYYMAFSSPSPRPAPYYPSHMGCCIVENNRRGQREDTGESHTSHTDCMALLSST
jgi:hypothetical protein